MWRSNRWQGFYYSGMDIHFPYKCNHRFASPELFWYGEILSSSCIRFSNDWLVRDSIMLFAVLVRNPLNSISFSNWNFKILCDAAYRSSNCQRNDENWLRSIPLQTGIAEFILILFPVINEGYFCRIGRAIGNYLPTQFLLFSTANRKELVLTYYNVIVLAGERSE